MHHFISSAVARTSKSGWATASCLQFRIALSCLIGVWILGLNADAQNQVTFEVTDRETGEAVPARIEFTKSAKKLPRDRKNLTAGDIWLAEGTLEFQPPIGDYEFHVRRGPEFNGIQGGFTIQRGSRDSIAIEIPRSIDMHAEHWFSGDLAAFIEPSPLRRWQMADAIDMAVHAKVPLSQPASPTKGRNSLQVDAPKFSAPDQVGHGWTDESLEYRSTALGLALHRLPSDRLRVGDEGSKGNGSDPYRMLATVRDDSDAMAEITQLWSADVPILLADPKVRCARILSFANRPKKDDAIAFPKQENSDADAFGSVLMSLGKERLSIPVLAPFPVKDRIRYKGPRGAGMLAEAIYWQALEAGLRLTPTAASGFGIVPETTMGYNRMYAYCDSEPTSEAWWNAVAQGETFVTNGPLLRVLINGVPPGTVQASYRGEPIGLHIDVSLAVREPVDYLDVIFNGESLYNAKLEDHYRRGEFPELTLDRSGWVIVRVITAHEEGYRYASTAPYYLEFNGQPRISKQAVQFFQDWLERSGRMDGGAGDVAEGRSEAFSNATRFWRDRLERANAP